MTRLQFALERGAEICDAVGLRGATGRPSNVVGAMRASVAAVTNDDRVVLEAFDRAVAAAFKSGAASCAWAIREEARGGNPGRSNDGGRKG